jgi:hypothetical protein
MWILQEKSELIQREMAVKVGFRLVGMKYCLKAIMKKYLAQNQKQG